jgi:Tol biopolymer transport system component/predicted Ser/Thr protein kinase
MTPERWRQINDVFQAAVEVAPEQRTAFLDKACTTDQTLRSEVESLLASDEHEWKLIEQPALEVAAPLLADDQPRLAPGQNLSHYVIDSLIGKGGMGEVYLAKDKQLNRRVALKLLPVEYTRNEDRLRRFQQEAQAASALNHPNILTIHEVGHIDDQQFIATEFVEGETLRERLKDGPLNLPETLDIAIQIAGALAAAHRAGIVHRDIKPENIMLRPDGYVKVLDFGLAKLTEQKEPTAEIAAIDNLESSSGLVMGTVKYMSPEQAHGLPVDARSDIFSLGVVLYEMVTGRALWKGETAGALIRSILNDEPPRLQEFLPDATEELQRILSKALNKDTTKRYRRADDLLCDLKALEARTTSSLESVVSLIRRHRTATALGLVSLVVVLGGLAYPLRKLLGKRAAPFERTQITRLTRSGEARSGEVRGGGAVISLDGRYIAYVLRISGQRSIWIRQLDANADAQVVAPTDAALSPVCFTPDSRYLYYRKVNGDSSLYRVSVFGGTAEKLLDSVGVITFSPDAQRIAFIRSDQSQGLTALVVANADGTGQRDVASRKAPDYFPSDRQMSWSPSGKAIACVGVDARDGYDRVFEVSIETGSQKPLTSQKWDGGIQEVAWLPNSSALLFTAGDSSTSVHIWRLSYPGGELQKLTNDTNFYLGLSLTADSSSLVTLQWEYIEEIWTAAGEDVKSAKRITPGRNDGGSGLTWAPDGRIIYASEASGRTTIWIMNADGTGQMQLTTGAKGFDVDPSGTADGRYIVFGSNRTGAEHIWRMDIDGGNQKQLTFGAVERSPHCSPDSNWIVYNSWESGKAAVWKIPVDGGTPVQITDIACFSPAVSPDGKLIACNSETPPQRLIIPFASGKPIRAFDLPQPRFAVHGSPWTLDGRALTYLDVHNDALNIWSQPIDGTSPKQLTNLKSEQGKPNLSLGNYAWSADGGQLAFVHIESRAEVVLIRDLK